MQAVVIIQIIVYVALPDAPVGELEPGIIVVIHFPSRLHGIDKGHQTYRIKVDLAKAAVGFRKYNLSRRTIEFEQLAVGVIPIPGLHLDPGMIKHAFLTQVLWKRRQVDDVFHR